MRHRSTSAPAPAAPTPSFDPFGGLGGQAAGGQGGGVDQLNPMDLDDGPIIQAWSSYPTLIRISLFT